MTTDTLTGLEAVALRGIRAREEILAENRRRLAADVLAVRADFAVAMATIADRLGLDPAGYGRDYRINVERGLVVRGATGVDDHADRVDPVDHDG